MIVTNITPIIVSAAGCSIGNIRAKGNIIATLSTKNRIIHRQNSAYQKEKASDQDTVFFMFFSI